MEKVDWRFEYYRDNIANIVMTLMSIVILSIDSIPDKIAFLPLICSFSINFSANQFFNKRKYH